MARVNLQQVKRKVLLFLLFVMGLSSITVIWRAPSVNSFPVSDVDLIEKNVTISGHYQVGQQERRPLELQQQEQKPQEEQIRQHLGQQWPQPKGEQGMQEQGQQRQYPQQQGQQWPQQQLDTVRQLQQDQQQQREQEWKQQQWRQQQEIQEIEHRRQQDLQLRQQQHILFQELQQQRTPLDESGLQRLQQQQVLLQEGHRQGQQQQIPLQEGHLQEQRQQQQQQIWLQAHHQQQQLLQERHRQEQFQQSSSDPVRTKVLIYSRARSGSSFLGGLFDQSPDVLYFYEPLRKETALYNRALPDIDRHKSNELSKLYNCDLSSSWVSYFLSNQAREFLAQPGRGAFFQRMFKETEGSWKYRTLDEIQQTMNDHCKRQSHTVVKCIDRVKSLESLESLLDPRFRVIFLVRDPRAVLMSRLNLDFDPALDLSLDFLCGSALSDVSFLRRKFNDPSSANVMILRYEDLVHDPLRMTELLFRFVNLSIDSRVVEWLSALSSSPSPANGDKFSIHRNPFQIDEKWRQIITPTTLTEVQNNSFCQRYMHLFGYIPMQLKDVTDLRVRSLNTWYNGDKYFDFVQSIILGH